MTQQAMTIHRKHAAKEPAVSRQIEELSSIVNSIITNIQGQSDVNEAFTKRLLALEDRIAKLESQRRPEPSRAEPGPPPTNLVGLVRRADQGNNIRSAVYLGEHLAIAHVLDRFKMYVDTRDISLAPHLLLEGYWEMWITKIFCDLLRPGITVVDVGANVGYYALLAAAGVGLQGHVHAIEADPRNFEILEKNVEVNGYRSIVKTHPCAALDTRREVLLYQYRQHYGRNSIFGDPSDPNIRRSVSIPGIPLDELITEPVDLMKIDAEGSEPLIFEGMPQLLQRSPDIRILMEFAPQMIRATMDPLEFLRRIRAAGLNCQVVTYEAKLESWPDEKLLASNITTVLLTRR